MSQKAFRQLVMTAADTAGPELAIAACRAGAIGIFNAGNANDAAPVDHALSRLAAQGRNPFGLRLPETDALSLDTLIDTYRTVGLEWLTVPRSGRAPDAECLARFRKGGGKVLLEAQEWPGSDGVAAYDGLVIRDVDQTLGSALVTACEASPVPVYAAGNLGLSAHAVCLAAGAAGMVYDAQLRALAESPETDGADERAVSWARRFANVAGALSACRDALRDDLDALLSHFGSGEVDRLVVVPDVSGAQLDDDSDVPIIRLDAIGGDVADALAPAAKAWSKRPWGVELVAADGAPSVAEFQSACRAAGARFVVLSGARPDQALPAGSDGLPAFLPVHSAGLLEMCLRQGVSHFVCEADSLANWSALLKALQRGLENGAKAGRLTVLLRYAGSDAAQAAAMLAPFASLGVHTGFVVDGEASVALPDIAVIKALRKRRRGLDKRKRRLHRKPADIAIVGIGCKLPRAGDAAEFWENMLDRVNGISEIPADRWDWSLYFNDDRHAEDQIYSRWGGFLDDVPFDPMRFGMPPKSIRAIDPMQLMALEVVRQTLEDAGYDKREFDRERVSVVMGCTGGTGDVGSQYAVRAETPRYAGHLPDAVAERLPEWTEDSFAGILLNVTAGRAANRFNFGGVNFTVDSACASSLTAVYQAVTELESGRSDMAIAGGVDTVQGPFGYLCFSKTQALSPRGQCSTFDQSADGIVISEGIAMVAMKRLADAERDGDRIYAVIKGVGGSSDGRARSMTAPHPDGQIRALERAYDHAGYSPATVGLFEAHGTGTVAGDTAELETVVRVLEKAGAKPHSTVIGSVKTLIGHTKGTAGIAGLVKTALAVYHGVQPPHANVTRPNARISRSDCPVSLLPAPRPWITAPGAPRRASVSAFGFGGTNFHVTMEQYQGDFLDELKPARRRHWPGELLVWRAGDAAALAASVRATAGWLATSREPRLRDLSWTLLCKAPEEGLTACVVATDTAGLPARLSALAAHVLDPGAQCPEDAWYSADPLGADGGVAVVFAGQGTQYPDMLRQVGVAFSELGETLAVADATLDRPLSNLVFPRGRYYEDSERAAASAVMSPPDGLPALAAVQTGMLRLFRRFGLKPDMAVGHSFGEYAALHAAGVISLEDLFRLARARGETLAEASDNYALAQVACEYEKVAEAASAVGDVWVASHTAPGKCTVSGVRSAVLALLETLNLPQKVLPTSIAVHTPLAAASARKLFREVPAGICNSPEIPVYCNATGQPYPEDGDELLAAFSQQMAEPVRFVEQIRNMHDDGARIFLGLGPRNKHGSPIVDILGDRPHLAVHVDDGEGGMLGLLRCVGALVAEGVPLALKTLSAGRNCQVLELDRPDPGGPGRGSKEDLPRHYWLLNGSSARPAGEPAREPLRRAANASLPLTKTTILEPQVSEEKETGNKWENEAMSTTAKEIPAQLMDGTTDESHEFVLADERDVVFQAYQDTMRQFLSSQESVMIAYLTGEASQALTHRVLVGLEHHVPFVRQNEL
ncbi:MAG: beta-ketoacyl synthase N-terminal-like domain-containing protein, partial [Pseudomonadota bacterium]